jgi:selenocysteine lyase/cysteine desulfurase
MLYPIHLNSHQLTHRPGSFGAIPRAIRDHAQSFRDQCESHPDPFIRYLYPQQLDTSRAAIASFLHVPRETCVFVPNATTGVATILRSLVWNPDAKDEILYFNTIYGACGKNVDYVTEISLGRVRARRIQLTYPISDAFLLAKFSSAIAASRAEGRRPRIAIFDTISSMPGLRMPFEALTRICRDEGILSLIDGAHGVGQIPLCLGEGEGEGDGGIDPDFFVSNCHKWLFVPRGCAVLYVPLRNQHLIRSTLPTSHGFVPCTEEGRGLWSNPLPPPQGKSVFQTNFEFVGTVDSTPYLCVAEAIKWREEACGGEEAIWEWCHGLVVDGARKVAELLGTEVLENEEGTLTKCVMANVRLPLRVAAQDEDEFQTRGGETEVESEYVIKHGCGSQAGEWMTDTMMVEYDTFLAIFPFQGGYWVRLCGQVYLDADDFVWAGKVLKDLCERVGKGEYLGAKKRFGRKDVLEGGHLAVEGVGAIA